MKAPRCDACGFVRWARQALRALSAVDPSGSATTELTALGELIGDATIVALGEGVHFAAEPLEFRNRVFQYLVQEKGFTAIAIESGLAEGRLVQEYVQGGAGDLASVLRAGFSWGFDGLPQNAALVRWLRQYNTERRPTHQIRFYGFDISASNPDTDRGSETALLEVLKYLARVDATAGEAFHARLETLLPAIRFDFRRPLPGSSYERLSLPMRDLLTATIADLIALLERREAYYLDASPQEDYQWACRSAIVARQTDNFLRQIPPQWRVGDEALDCLLAATDVRDRAQADNLDWILRQEGSAGKILVFAHNTHLSAAPYTMSPLLSPEGTAAVSARRAYESQPAGTYLRRRFGKRLVTIGHLLGSGSIGSGFEQRLRLVPQALDELAGAADVPRFLLDLRQAPAAISRWLEQPRPLGSVTTSGTHEILREVAVGKAFDILFYVDTVTRACS